MLNFAIPVDHQDIQEQLTAELGSSVLMSFALVRVTERTIYFCPETI